MLQLVKMKDAHRMQNVIFIITGNKADNAWFLPKERPT